MPDKAIHAIDSDVIPEKGLFCVKDRIVTIIQSAIDAMIRRQKLEKYGPMLRTALEKKNGASVQQHEANKASKAPE